jgi:two-component system heavy metal sensor histidine kinase CusS
LRGADIPDIKGKHTYNAVIPGVGEARVNEFLLPPFDVTIATPTRALRESMQAYVNVCLALLAVMLMVSIVIGLGLSRLMLRPLRQISDTANRIRSDNLSERVPASDVRDEISDLARLLNQMFDRLEIAFDQVRRFSDEASHELKTPLSLIRLHAEKMLSDDNLAPAHAEAVVVQIEELARLNQIIDELLFLSRAQARAIVFKRQQQTPEHLLEQFTQDAVALAEHCGRRFASCHAGAGLVAFEEKWIRQVLLNLLTNALNVSPADGLVTLRSELADGRWRVSIEDEGPGLTPDQRARIFDRFVRFNIPQDGDRGSGLGLAICQSIVELHGGRIFAVPREGVRGLKVVFEIPAARGA